MYSSLTKDTCIFSGYTATKGLCLGKTNLENRKTKETAPKEYFLMVVDGIIGYYFSQLSSIFQFLYNQHV